MFGLDVDHLVEVDVKDLAWLVVAVLLDKCGTHAELCITL